MKGNQFRKLVREELRTMLNEAKEKAPDLEKKLETLRKKLESEMVKYETTGWTSNNRPQKRVQINTVAKLLEVPVSDLMLHFMNVTKLGLSENPLISYHLGHVYFECEAPEGYDELG